MSDERNKAMSGQMMARQLEKGYENLWHVVGMIDDDELDSGTMSNGLSPKVLLGGIATWNTIHVRRIYKCVNPEHSSFVESVNGGIATDEDVARLRLVDEKRAEVDAKIPLAAVLEEVDQSQEWCIGMLGEPDGKIARYLQGDTPEPQVELIFGQMMKEMRGRTRALRRWAGSMSRWAKADFLELLESQHELLLDSVAGLDEKTILATITHEPWSMRDELVHLLAWNEFTLYVVDHWPAPDPAGVAQWLSSELMTEDMVNDVLLGERAQMNMIDVVDGLATVHRKTMKRLSSMDEATLASEGDWLFNTTGDLSGFVYTMALHQAEHSEWLWRTRIKLEE